MGLGREEAGRSEGDKRGAQVGQTASEEQQHTRGFQEVHLQRLTDGGGAQ